MTLHLYLTTMHLLSCSECLNRPVVNVCVELQFCEYHFILFYRNEDIIGDLRSPEEGAWRQFSILLRLS